MNTTKDSNATQWIAVSALFVAGCTTTLHMGKVPSALPLLREQWQLSLTQTGLIVAIYSILIALSGLLLGSLVQRIGYAKFAVVGVALVGVGSFLGLLAEDLPWFLVSRAIEGLGWIVAVIALPSLLAALSHDNDRVLVMGIWGGFVPMGTGIMLLLAPRFQESGGWHLSWQVAAVLSFAGALLSLIVVRKHRERLQILNATSSVRTYTDLRKGLVWILCGCFLMYALQFLAVTAFLPTLFVETGNLSLGAASRLTAIVIISNVIGTLTAGVSMRRGVSHRSLLIIGGLSMGLCSLAVFSLWLPPTLRIAYAFGFSIGSGLIPGTLFATMPKLACNASSVGILIGLMMQFAGVGQVVGGIVIPAVVELASSWQAAGYVGLLCGLVGALLALRTSFDNQTVTRSSTA